MYRTLSATIALSLMALPTCGIAQETLYSRVMTSQQIAEQKSFDEFRVKEMQQLVTNINSDTVADLLASHMNNNTKTVINYDTKEVFVQYSSPDGTTYTWHPNDTTVTKGTWKIGSDQSGGKTVCFQSGNATSPTCIPSPYILSEYCTLKMTKDDKYSLKAGIVPYAKTMSNVPE